MKKIALAALTALALIGSAFAESSVSFYNKIFEEDYFYANNDGETQKDFPVVKDEMNVEYKSEHVDAALKVIAGIDDFDDRHFGMDGYIDDWYLEWRLFQPVTIGLHDNIYSEGSALPIYDDNLANGNIGSNGFTVVYRPSIFENKLRLGATLPFEFTKTEDEFGKKPNWLKAKKTIKDEDDNETETDDDKYVNLGLGAIYTDDLFQVGFTVKDISNSDTRLVGVTVSFPDLFGAVEGLTIGGGFSNAKGKDAGFDDLISVLGTDYGVTGKNIINANLSLEKEAFSVVAEALYNTKNDEGDYDLYSAAVVGIPVNEQLVLNAGGKTLMDLNSDTKDNNKNIYSVLVGTEYTIDEHNQIGVEFDFFTCDKTKAFAVPVFWKWTM
ncbi:hypothetical protein [Treponema sp.]|uniref:hypothetical protein n=1 Tax=Treponema sp. TaxID=166 RepID=UPI00298E75B2|nr:hypothetical protein [Treponema sp.]MCQ2241883.1 hypothetical protein [Treponema sp.]